MTIIYYTYICRYNTESLIQIYIHFKWIERHHLHYGNVDLVTWQNPSHLHSQRSATYTIHRRTDRQPHSGSFVPPDSMGETQNRAGVIYGQLSPRACPPDRPEPIRLWRRKRNKIKKEKNTRPAAKSRVRGWLMRWKLMTHLKEGRESRALAYYP